MSYRFGFKLRLGLGLGLGFLVLTAKCLQVCMYETCAKPFPISFIPICRLQDKAYAKNAEMGRVQLELHCCKVQLLQLQKSEDALRYNLLF